MALVDSSNSLLTKRLRLFARKKYGPSSTDAPSPPLPAAGATRPRPSKGTPHAPTFQTIAVSVHSALIALPALAQAPCAPHDALVATIADSFGEALQGVGLQSNSTLLEIYVSDESGTWTILVTRPDGMSCMIAA